MAQANLQKLRDLLGMPESKQMMRLVDRISLSKPANDNKLKWDERGKFTA